MADARIRQGVKLVDATIDGREANVDASGNLQIIAAPNTGVDIGDVTINGPLGGGVEAGALLVTIASDSTGVLTVDNGGTFIVQEDGDALTALQLIDDIVAVLGTATYSEGTTSGAVIGAVRNDTLAALADTDNEIAPLQVDATGALYVNIAAGAAGVTHTDNAAFTEDSDDGVPAFGLFHDVTPPAVTEGNAGAVRMSANRNLYNTLRDAAGNERGANVNASNELGVVASQNGTWNITNISGTISLPTGAATESTLALVESNTDYGTVVGGGVEATALRVTIASDSTGQITIDGTVSVDSITTSVVPGTGATHLGKAISSASGATDTGVAALVQRDDALTTLAEADGEYALLRVDDVGRLHVTDPNAGAGSPTNPVVENPALANIAGGATSTGTELRTSDLGNSTKRLAGFDVSSSAPFKATLIQEDDDAETIKIRGLFGRAAEPLQWRPPNKDYFAVAFGNNAGFDGWRVEITNLDNSQTTDFYVTYYYED